MMQNNAPIYLSLSKAASPDDVREVRNTFKGLTAEWRCGTGSPSEYLKGKEVVICVPPEENNDYRNSSRDDYYIGRGTYDELYAAIDLDIPVYAYYKGTYHDVYGVDHYDTNDWKLQYGVVELSNKATVDEILSKLSKAVPKLPQPDGAYVPSSNNLVLAKKFI